MFGVLPLLGATASQGRPGGLVAAVAVKGNAVLVLVTEIVCVVGLAPTRAVTLIAAWLTFSSGDVLTFIVTGTTSAVEVELGAVRVISPLHTCDVVSPVVTTETTTWFWLPKVFPVAGEAVRKPLQLVVVAAAWKLRGVPVLLTLSVWLGGDA